MIHLRVPSTLRCRVLIVAAIRAGCDAAAERLGRPITDRFVDELVTAGGEAFNNIVIHGYAGSADGEVELELAISNDGDGICVTFRDTGRAFHPDAATAPDFDTLPENGMGVFLVRSLVDVVRYQPGGVHGSGAANELALEKRLEA